MTACTPSIDPFQSALDSYTESAFRGNLEASLTGAALHQAMESRALLNELGWTQVGRSSFQDSQLVAEARVISCLDVSEVSFLDSSGAEVEISRKSDRVLMEIEFSKSNPPLVASIREVGGC